MREQYYNFIKENKISDILSEIPDISYTVKMNILKEFLKLFSAETINRALNRYKIDYIDNNRVILFRLKNLLHFYCKYYKILSD